MSSVAVQDDRPWVDRKRYLWLLGILAMTLPVQGYLLYCWTGWSVFWWFSPIFIYLILPIADALLGEDDNNPPDSAMAALAADRYYRWAVYLALPFQYLTFIWGTWMAVRGGLLWHQWLGLLLSVGFTSGLGINIAHEMGHQTSKLERWLAKIALAPVAYGHFYVEHNRGHHVRVATFEDPASARYGESFWEFLPRCVIGSFRSAWEIEKQRLARKGKGPWSLENDLIQAWLLTLALYAAMTAWLGWAALPFMILQAAYGGSLLEVVNYLEHYGLLRARRPDGTYERCQPEHSWNSNHIATNIFLYHLQRHSDHHAYPTRSYQTLRNFEGLPRLPSGYAAMIPIAYCTPLWFAIMNRKVRDQYGGDLSRANLKPALRRKLLAGERRAAA
ncbi:MAG: alkane 1-monooxygenase [Nevskia sp.]|nr:alkane 1-monooxygenase [Nevskia sp.]